MKKILYTVVLMLITLSISSQTNPFLEEVYPEIKITNDIVYGENATILYFPVFNEAVKVPLLLDLYQPIGDDCERPLIIYFHSGNFLPFPDNQNIVGTKRDSSVVAMCKRLAKCGYAVASADYRLGWNPVATTINDRKLGLINAAYRGVQDANTCVRYFKKSMVEQGNPYKIDTSRIILWGDDSGGYLALNAGCLDDYIKIPTASDAKFWYGDLFPMVIESINGDVEAKEYGINNQPTPFPFPIGDTLCYVNHPEYSSKFHAVVNLSGAVGDSAWIDPGQPPVISIHTPYDLTTPYEEGIVYVYLPPDTYLEVVEVQGSSIISNLSTQYGNNDGMGMPSNATPFQVAVSDVAFARNGGREGVYPIIGDAISDANPWVFWDCETNENCQNGLAVNPNMSKEKAVTYMDTILAYVLPRLYTVLSLDDYPCIVATREILASDPIEIAVTPNPSSDEILVTTEDGFPIRSLSVFDMKGTLIDHYADIQSYTFRFPVYNLVSGQYILKIKFDDGIAARQIVVK